MIFPLLSDVRQLQAQQQKLKWYEAGLIMSLLNEPTDKIVLFPTKIYWLSM